MLLIFCYVYVHMSGYMAFIYCGRLIFSNQRTCLSNLPWRGMLSWCFIPCLECCLSSHSSKTQPSSGTELTSPLSGTLPWPAHPEMAFFSFLPSFSKYVLKVHSVRQQLGNRSYRKVVSNQQICVYILFSQLNCELLGLYPPSYYLHSL